MQAQVSLGIPPVGTSCLSQPLGMPARSCPTCPVQSAEDEFKVLQREPLLKGASCGLLHGRMSGEEKAAALTEFATGKTQVLVSTTVVEVGCSCRTWCRLAERI